MDRLSVECALLPGDVVYVRGETTLKKSAVAEVLAVNRGPKVTVLVRLITGWLDWSQSEPRLVDGSDAEITVTPSELEEIRE